MHRQIILVLLVSVVTCPLHSVMGDGKGSGEQQEEHGEVLAMLKYRGVECNITSTSAFICQRTLDERCIEDEEEDDQNATVSDSNSDESRDKERAGNCSRTAPVVLQLVDIVEVNENGTAVGGEKHRVRLGQQAVSKKGGPPGGKGPSKGHTQDGSEDDTDERGGSEKKSNGKSGSGKPAKKTDPSKSTGKAKSKSKAKQDVPRSKGLKAGRSDFGLAPNQGGGQINISYDVFLLSEDGAVQNDNETTNVTAGQMKLTMTLQGWRWCNNDADDDVECEHENGTHIVLSFMIESKHSKKKPPKHVKGIGRGQPSQFAMGDAFIDFSKKALLDNDTWVDTDPKMVEEDETEMEVNSKGKGKNKPKSKGKEKAGRRITVRIPRFHSMAEYDPVVEVGTEEDKFPEGDEENGENGENGDGNANAVAPVGISVTCLLVGIMVALPRRG